MTTYPVACVPWVRWTIPSVCGALDAVGGSTRRTRRQCRGAHPHRATPAVPGRATADGADRRHHHRGRGGGRRGGGSGGAIRANRQGWGGQRCPEVGAQLHIQHTSSMVWPTVGQEREGRPQGVPQGGRGVVTHSLAASAAPAGSFMMGGGWWGRRDFQ